MFKCGTFLLRRFFCIIDHKHCIQNKFKIEPLIFSNQYLSNSKDSQCRVLEVGEQKYGEVIAECMNSNDKREWSENCFNCQHVCEQMCAVEQYLLVLYSRPCRGRTVHRTVCVVRRETNNRRVAGGSIRSKDHPPCADATYKV